jgi:hypothetical protein
VDLVRRHVALFNDAVRTGDRAPFAALFADDAELRFSGVPVGPFHGRAAIEEAYRRQPPDDEIRAGEPRREDGLLVVPYERAAAPAVPAGELRMVERDGLLQHLMVVYGA